ncbi:hypothetical protein ACS5PU_06990 [Pedobacter sp. GSP4]|uniref:hypothetical protein n=1 Tax=Pedobacter sp. GSP4 TaxID=3453716 RepID=UPI003EE87032
MIRTGKIIYLDEIKSTGIIQDENEQEIGFDISEWIDGLYLGASVNFNIALCSEGLTAVDLSFTFLEAVDEKGCCNGLKNNA